MTDDRQDSEDPPLRYKGGIPLIPGPVEREDAARAREKIDEQRYKEKQVSIQRGNLLTQIGLLIFGLLGLAVGSWQANVAQQAADVSQESVLLAQKTERDTRLIGEKQIAQTQIAIEENRKQNRAALNSGAETSMRELRPYVSVGDMLLVGNVDDGQAFKGIANVINSGRTPAVSVKACGDVFVSGPENPMSDDFPCPNPGNLKPVSEGEPSVATIGSGTSIQVSSPGSRPDERTPLASLLKAHAFKLYFYGYINYKDTIDGRITHHTTFCGMYGVDSKRWNVCEKHNHTD